MSFYEHLVEFGGRSVDLFSRLRCMTSAGWGVNQASARRIYRSVYLLQMAYVAYIWCSATLTKKVVQKLGSFQRRPLLAMTGAYRTVSTDAL